MIAGVLRAIGIAVLAYFVVGLVISDFAGPYAGIIGVGVGICVFLYFRPDANRDSQDK